MTQRSVAPVAWCCRGGWPSHRKNPMSKYAKRTQKYVNYETVEAAAEAGRFDLVQPKYDGWWACAVIKRGIASIYSRQGILKAEAEVPKRMPHSVLIGEYLVGTQRATGSDAAGRLVVFDAVELGGNYLGDDHEYHERLEIAVRAAALCEWMTPSVCYSIRASSRAWTECLAARGEGLVFRNSHDGYESAVIGRVKRSFTMDYVVMDVLPGQGRHAGRMGAVVCGLYEGGELVEKVRVGGGWSDREREVIWKRPRSYIGRVLEVRGWQVFASGSMRHPQAVVFRDDKDASECVLAKKEVR